MQDEKVKTEEGEILPLFENIALSADQKEFLTELRNSYQNGVMNER